MLFIIRILAPAICFATGFFIPILSRFLMKFYPCSMHSFIGDTIKFYFNKSKLKIKHQKNKYKYLKKQFFFNKILWGFFYLLVYVILIKHSFFKEFKTITLIVLFIYIFLLGFTSNIDNRFTIIPDIITYPLLMLGFLFSITVQNSASNIFDITPNYSILSSILTYFLCSITALLFYFKNPYSFGGGDVKLLSAIAGFIGMKNISFLLLLAFIISSVLFLIKKDKYIKLAPVIFLSFLILIGFKISI